MNDITKPLQLAIGSHEAGSGMGCAMNVISWENGDTEITDFPACSDHFLSRLVQAVNDHICTHREDTLLCPECSITVLNLGHKTVGTAVDFEASSDRLETYRKLVVSELDRYWASGALSGWMLDHYRASGCEALARFDNPFCPNGFKLAHLVNAVWMGVDDPHDVRVVENIIDRFIAEFNITPAEIAPETTAKAVENMLVTT